MSTHRSIRSFIAVVLVLIAVGWLFQWGRSASELPLRGPVATLTGKANVRPAGEETWRSIAQGPVAIGDRLHAAQVTTITFFDGSMLILQPDAVVDIVDAIPEGNQVTVALRSGVMAVRSTNPRFALQTPGLTASVQDAFYTIEVQATGQTTLVAEQGAILGRTKEGVVALAQGEQMRVGPSQPASIGPARPPTLPTPPAPPTRTPTRVPTPVQTVVPAQRIHIVSEGDTLSYLAVKYGTTVEAIMQANHLDDPHTLSIGQRLIIP